MNGGEGSATATQIHIHCTADLVAAVRGDDEMVRVAVLRAIAANPAMALGYGPEDGRDLIDELLGLVEDTAPSATRATIAHTLLSIPEPRVVAFAAREFGTATDAAVVVQAGQRLATLPDAERVALLSPIVLEPGRPVHSRVAANLLARVDGLAPEVAVRVALLSDHAVLPPAVTAATEAAWLAELAGPYPSRTRDALTSLGAPALDHLFSIWDRLDETAREWVLLQGAELDRPAAAARIRGILGDADQERLLLLALECLPLLRAPALPPTALTRFHLHPLPAVRAAAIRAGSLPIDWSTALYLETVPEVRLALLERLAEVAAGEHLPLLVRLLEDGDWRVRSRVTEILVGLGEAAAPALRAVLAGGGANARVAAAQALVQLGKELWLEEDLIR